MTDELNLSANQLDALREIGNVGAGCGSCRDIHACLR